MSTPDKFDLLTMKDAYELWRDADRMQGVETCFGGRQKHQQSAMPYVRWEPTQDQITLGSRAEFGVQPRGPGGTNQVSSVRAKHVRSAGVSLFMYAKDDFETENLLAQVVLALEDTFGAEANCKFTAGAWNLARAQVQKAERYELRVVLALPIVRILPAANTESVNVTPEVV